MALYQRCRHHSDSTEHRAFATCEARALLILLSLQPFQFLSYWKQISKQIGEVSHLFKACLLLRLFFLALQSGQQASMFDLDLSPLTHLLPWFPFSLFWRDFVPFWNKTQGFHEPHSSPTFLFWGEASQDISSRAIGPITCNNAQGTRGYWGLSPSKICTFSPMLALYFNFPAANSSLCNTSISKTLIHSSLLYFLFVVTQGQLLVLCLGIAPGGGQRTICNARNQILICVQSMQSFSLLSYLSASLKSQFLVFGIPSGVFQGQLLILCSGITFGFVFRDSALGTHI